VIAGRVVAGKYSRPEMLANGEAVESVASEVRAAVEIKDEHVARAIDVGTPETGAHYIFIEFLQCENLAGWLQRRGLLACEDAADFVQQAKSL
jgi:hypothetical protein